MSKILITTTPTLENAKIVKYYGVVTSNVVLGVNFFSDFIASFSDVFGGHSGTYRDKLETIYSDVIKELEFKADAVNANAIVGLSIDFDEISGKDKQMFMATAKGTACKVVYNEETLKDNIGSDVVTFESMEQRYMTKQYLKLLESMRSGVKLNWEYIFSHDIPEIAYALVNYWLNVVNKVEYPTTETDEFKRNIMIYLAKLDNAVAKKALYPFYMQHTDVVYKPIVELKLFDADEVIRLFNDDHLHKAIKLLNASKPTYSKEDLSRMQTILSIIDSLPDTGKIEKVLGGIFSKKEVDKFICEDGHKNDIDVEHCNMCGKNIKGLVPDEVKSINKFRGFVESLQELFQ